MDFNSVKQDSIKILSTFLFLIPVALIAFFYVTYFGPDKEKLEIKDHQVVITECRYPLKSTFNRNTLTLEQSQIIYHQRAIWGDKTIKVPFSDINKATFTHGIYFYSMKLHKRGSFSRSYSVYYKEESTDKDLRGKLNLFAPNIKVVETDSLLRGMENLVDRILN